MNVAVMGASNKPDRYSYKAVKLLAEKGHVPFPVHPALKEVDGRPVYASIGDIEEPIDTITLYLSAENSSKVATGIIEAGARRVIFNPGTENPDLESRLSQEGVETIEACTLVLLKTDQF